MRASSVDQIILETLRKEHTHLSSHEVYEQIRQQLPAVNPSTVYRALERLANNGKISVSDMGTGVEVYESLSNGLHHHLVCQKCGHVATLSNDEVQAFFASIQQAHQFQIITNHLILFGVCNDCREANREEK
jgi:Fur family transcriptional regulator, ferric uptake regulator